MKICVHCVNYPFITFEVLFHTYLSTLYQLLFDKSCKIPNPFIISAILQSSELVAYNVILG